MHGEEISLWQQTIVFESSFFFFFFSQIIKQLASSLNVQELPPSSARLCEGKNAFQHMLNFLDLR